MTSDIYKIEEDSLQSKFFKSRNKIQIYGGGFANGKTSALVIRALEIARDYPSANILLGRATYPKLNDTLRTEFFKWCPKKWIKSFDKDSNTVVLVNDTTINFRYVQQQNRKSESSTSNLLSANYDFIGIDQVDDPEITYKDFLDLLGRLRGRATYRGSDPTMPRSGPRWFSLTCNPTRNWVYRRLILPLHLYNASKGGTKHPDLLVDTKEGKPIIDLFEGSTFGNASNLEPDYLETLKATYKGQQYSRFVLGEWGAYEGLIYPEFDTTIHIIPRAEMQQYLKEQRRNRQINWLLGYDHGIRVPSCFLASFVDENGMIHCVDGIYEAEMHPETIGKEMRRIRREYQIPDDTVCYADPQIFKRAGTIGATVADMLNDQGARVVRGNNEISSGIAKIKSYLQVNKIRINPYTKTFGGPMMFLSDHMTWLVDEITDYFWQKDQTTGERVDIPIDRNDHALDTLKYQLTPRPKVGGLLEYKKDELPAWMKWGEREAAKQDPRNAIRH